MRARFRFKQITETSGQKPLPYRRRGPLLSRGEMAFYRVLRRAVGKQFHIAFKVRLADLVTCSERAWADGFGHMIARHHIDFVLCEYRSMDVVAAIELDDRSHARNKRASRDRFIDDALASAGIPLIRIRAASRYDAVELCETFAATIHLSSARPAAD